MTRHRVNTFVSAAVAFALAGRASAQLVYEPFGYTAGTALDNQINPVIGLPWSKMSANGGDDDILLTAGSLTYAGLAAPTGNSVSYSATGKSERLAIGPVISSGSVYYSLTFQLTGMGAMGTSPALIAGFSNQTGTSLLQPTAVGTRLYLRQGSTSTVMTPTFNIGVSKNSSTTADIVFDVTEFQLNTPVLVVGGYTINGATAGTDDGAKLYINPSSFGSATVPTVSTPSSPILTAPTAGTDLFSGGPSVAGFVLRQGSAQVPDVRVDESRIDTTWAQVTPPTGVAWNVNSAGNWSENTKWSTGVAPNVASAFVNFGSVISAPRTVTVDVPVALRTINFTAPTSYTLAGAQSLGFSASAAINVISGDHTISAPIILSGDLLASVASGSKLSVTGGLTSNGNALTKSGAGTLEMNNIRAGRLSVFGGDAKVLANGTSTGTSRSTAIAINVSAGAPAARLNLSDNDLVIDYSGASPLGTWNGATYSAVTGMIAAGMDGGSWTGNGIITSQTNATTGLTTLGIGEAADLLGLGVSDTAFWSGQTVDVTSILIRYTYAGDANLDGFIDGTDYFFIDSNITVPGAYGYGNGDFNYDGAIDGTDYFFIDSNITQQGPSLGDSSPVDALVAVPEPVSSIMIGLMGSASLLRRRRRAAE